MIIQVVYMYGRTNHVCQAQHTRRAEHRGNVTAGVILHLQITDVTLADMT